MPDQRSARPRAGLGLPCLVRRLRSGRERLGSPKHPSKRARHPHVAAPRLLLSIRHLAPPFLWPILRRSNRRPQSPPKGSAAAPRHWGCHPTSEARRAQRSALSRPRTCDDRSRHASPVCRFRRWRDPDEPGTPRFQLCAEPGGLGRAARVFSPLRWCKRVSRRIQPRHLQGTKSERVDQASGSRSLPPGEATARRLAHETHGRRQERGAAPAGILGNRRGTWRRAHRPRVGPDATA